MDEKLEIRAAFLLITGDLEDEPISSFDYLPVDGTMHTSIILLGTYPEHGHEKTQDILFPTPCLQILKIFLLLEIEIKEYARIGVVRRCWNQTFIDLR